MKKEEKERVLVILQEQKVEIEKQLVWNKNLAKIHEGFVDQVEKLEKDFVAITKQIDKLIKQIEKK